MPGSIQVSVLEIKELPSTSNFVKVSLGKVEYEAWDKGDFSFPLKKLGDNLIITLQDAERNPIAHAEVQTTSIIKKGTWDDMFPFEGGGLVHMKLQFLLSKDERNRIRSMRESAMKKKQDEIINRKIRSLETADTSSSSLSPSLQRHETSDALSSMSSQDLRISSNLNDAVKAGQSTNAPDETFNKNGESGEEIKEGTLQRQKFPNVTDRREEASSSPMTEELEVHRRALVEDSGTRASHVDDPVGSVMPQEASETVLAGKKESADSNPSENVAEKQDKQDFVDKIPIHGVRLPKSTIAEKVKSFSPKLEAQPDNQAPLGKTPSNIKKMISAFESSASQDRGSLLKPLSAKSGLYGIGTVRLLNKNEQSEASAQSLRNSYSTGDLQKNVANIIKSGEKVGVDKEADATRILSKGMVASVRDKLNSGELVKMTKLSSQMESVSGRNLEERDSANTMGVPSSEAGTFLGQIHEKKVSVHSSEAGTFLGQINEKKVSVPSSEAGTFLGQIHEKKVSVLSAVKNETMFVQKEAETTELLKSREEDMMFSGRMLEEKKSAGTSLAEDRGKGTPLKNGIGKIYHKEDSEDNVEFLDGGSSDARIFPDESRHSCITAKDDKAVDLLGGWIGEGKDHQQTSNSSVQESSDKDKVHYGTDSQGEKISHESDHSMPESADEAIEVSSDGLLGQAIKIALVVGFGVLVLFFRQREPGNRSKKENNPSLKNQVFVTTRGSFREQLRKIDILRS